MNGALVKKLVLAVVVIVGHGAFGQERAGMVERLQTELGLSPEQVEKVEKIFAEVAAQRRPAAESAPAAGDRRAMRERRRAMREETEKLLGQVLTDEQMAKYREIAAERRRGMQGGRDARGPGEAQRRQGREQ